MTPTKLLNRKGLFKLVNDLDIHKFVKYRTGYYYYCCSNEQLRECIIEWSDLSPFKKFMTKIKLIFVKY